MSEAKQSHHTPNIDDAVEKIFQDKKRSPLAEAALAPVTGLKRILWDDTANGFKHAREVKKSKGEKSSGIGDFVKYYGGSAIGYNAAVLPHELLHKAASLATNVQLSPLQWFPYPGVIAGYGINSGSAAGIIATALAPYAAIVPFGMGLMASGAANGNMLKYGVGAGMASSPLFNLLGDYTVASKQIFGSYASTLSDPTGTALVIGGAAAILGGMYYLTRKIFKYFSGKKDAHKAEHGAEHAAHPDPHGGGGLHPAPAH